MKTYIGADVFHGDLRTRAGPSRTLRVMDVGVAKLWGRTFALTELPLFYLLDFIDVSCFTDGQARFLSDYGGYRLLLDRLRGIYVSTFMTDGQPRQ